jgi:hypothetical protein
MTDHLTPSNIKKAKELLQQCNKYQPGTSQWITNEEKLSSFLDDMITTDSELSKAERLKYYNSGIYDVATPIIAAELGKHQNRTVANAWLLIARLMAIPDTNEKDNVETLSKGVGMGFIELAVRELQFRPLRNDGEFLEYAFICIVAPAVYTEFVSRVIKSGAPLACLNLVREQQKEYLSNINDSNVSESNLSDAMRTLNFVAGYDAEVVKHLPGLVDCVRQFLPLLSNENGNDAQIMLGFSAARLLIRVFGKDDSSKVISENPIILQFYPQLLRKLCDVGPSKNYFLYSGYFKLAFVLLDLSLISMSDTNKSLLLPLVPLVIEMMVFHHNGNRDLLRHGMVFLSQVSFDESCLVALMTDKERIKTIQGIVLSDKATDTETLSLLSVVMNAVFPSSLSSSSIAASITNTNTPSITPITTNRRSSAFKKAASLVFGSNTPTPQIQVMISYHQKSTGTHAQALVQLF